MVDSTERKRAYVVFLPEPGNPSEYDHYPIEREIPDHKCLVEFLNLTDRELTIEFIEEGMTKSRRYKVKKGVPARVKMTEAFAVAESVNYKVTGGNRSGVLVLPNPRIVIPEQR